MVLARFALVRLRCPRQFAAVAHLLCIAALILPAAVRAASNDDNVEWDGVLSLPEDRSPLSPGKGEAFSVELQVFKGDITGARVRVWDGAERFHAMTWIRGDGTYDVWRATVAGTASDYLYYRFEITDGWDTDHYNSLGMWPDVPPHGDFLIVTTPLGAYPLGATPVREGSGVVFRVWAPNATSAAVAGTFNGWSTTANRMQSIRGFWEALAPGAHPGAEYKYVFDGSIWRTDPRARRQVNSVGNSIVVDPAAHVWRDAGWRTPDIDEIIIYELHVGSFSGEGDGVSHRPGRFRDAADVHLDHLVELGINAIGLMPVGEFAADRSWGYNPAFQYAPESAYGSPEDLKYLVDRCHQAGIAVILDVVYNHMGPQDLAGNILEYDGHEIYLYPPDSPYRNTDWGPRPDYGRVEVREFLRDNVRYWLEEFHLDGFRVDATSAIKVNTEGWQLLREIAQVARAVRPRAIVIAEQLPNDPAVTRPIELGGAGHHAQWHDDFKKNLRAALGAAAFGDPDMGSIAAAINHFGYPASQLVNYIESHDEVANHDRVSVVADSSDPDSPWAYGRAKFAASLVLFASGIPMLLQGQELLEDRRFGDSDDRRIQWRYRTEHADFFLFMDDAVELRRSRPALRASASQNVFHVNDGANVIAFHRWTGAGDDLVIVAGLANDDFADYELGFPRPGDWYEILNSDAAVYGGRNHGNGGRITAAGPPRHGLGQSARIVIPRMGVLVFSPTPPPPPGGFLRGDSDGDGRIDLIDAVRTLLIVFLSHPQGDCPAANDVDNDGSLGLDDVMQTLTYIFRGHPSPAPPWPDCGEAEGGLPCSRRCE